MLHHSLIGNSNSEYCLVFIHGFSCSGEDWKYQIDYFSNNYQILVPDLPGHGRSVNYLLAKGENYDIFTLSHAVELIIKQLEINKPLVLIGHSMAVRVALEVGNLLNKQVKALILIDSGYAPANARQLNKIQQQITNLGYKKWAQNYFSGMFTKHTPDEISQLVMANVNKLDKKIGTQLMSSIRTYDYYTMRKSLQLVTAKILLIQATFKYNNKRYSINKLSNVKDYWLNLVKDTVKKVQIEIVNDAGHFVMLEYPKEVNQMIEKLLSDL